MIQTPGSPQTLRGTLPPRRGTLPRRRDLLALPLLAALAACAPGTNLPVLSADRPVAYQLGVGDQIRVITYGEDQLSHDYRVGDDGSIAVPLLGAVHAEGLTTAELSTRIGAELRERKLVREPSVSVQVTDYRPIFVLGEVAKPGQYAFQPGMTMLTAVTVAGGFTYRAVQSYAYVVRLNGRQSLDGRVLPGGFLKPGDVVKVYERVF